VDTSYIFQWPRYRKKYGSELYNVFSDLPITVVLAPSRGMGSALANDVGARFGAKTRSISAIRREGRLITTDLPLTETDKVLVVDDGINTGNSLTQLLEDLSQKFHCECLGVGIFIDRYIGDLEKDFSTVGMFVTLFSLKNGYPIVHYERCRACKRLRDIDEELESLGAQSSSERRFELVKEKTSLFLRSAYQD